MRHRVRTCAQRVVVAAGDERRDVDADRRTAQQAVTDHRAVRAVDHPRSAFHEGVAAGEKPDLEGCHRAQTIEGAPALGCDRAVLVLKADSGILRSSMTSHSSSAPTSTARSTGGASAATSQPWYRRVGMPEQGSHGVATDAVGDQPLPSRRGGQVSAGFTPERDVGRLEHVPVITVTGGHHGSMHESALEARMGSLQPNVRSRRTIWRLIRVVPRRRSDEQAGLPARAYSVTKIQETGEQGPRQRRARDRRQAPRGPPRAGRPVLPGHLLIEDVPGHRQDGPGQGDRPQPRLLLPADPVHAGPAALRRDRACRSTTRRRRSSSSGRARS